ncbi:hypothetical protein [Stagnihabitans tardus]|uniref:Uncharacterized protein n=1 Tax=Stagnihabitans tardus TaxID=2699202 RepID=A0AAE4YAY7_9RHOB|nr:hypothetical protein [Stagnihabitans tardus]NBZ86605.1 hypothetical protein [Stagnihabitans tardus]
MKTLIAAVLLAAVAAPVLAMDHAWTTTATGVTVDTVMPGMDILGRRSGACREGSRCGGV